MADSTYDPDYRREAANMILDDFIKMRNAAYPDGIPEKLQDSKDDEENEILSCSHDCNIK